jgi:hypothetical protein
MLTHLERGKTLRDKILRQNRGEIVRHAGVVVLEWYAIDDTRGCSGYPHPHGGFLCKQVAS